MAFDINTIDEVLLHPNLQKAKDLYDTFSDFAKRFEAELDDNHEVGIIPLLPNGEMFHLAQIGRKDGVIWFAGSYANGEQALIVTDPNQFSFQLKPVLKLKDTVTKIGFHAPSES